MNRKKDLLPLLDADILAIESCFSGQIEEEGETTILPFCYVIDTIENKIQEIKDKLETRLDPICFLSGPTNFRYEIAKRKGYKENREGMQKPFHFENAKAFITSRYNTYTSVGCEADDLLSISQMENLRRKDINFNPEKAETVIVSRDKDLLQCQGWHYGWECGNQPERRLQWVDELGDLQIQYVDGVSPKTGKPTKRFKKLTGSGLKWFYAQMLTGDAVDNIPGLKGVGGVKAFNLLDGLSSTREMLEVCISEFKRVYEGEDWKLEMWEQANLVYILKERNTDGSLKYWEFDNEYAR